MGKKITITETQNGYIVEITYPAKNPLDMLREVGAKMLADLNAADGMDPITMIGQILIQEGISTHEGRNRTLVTTTNQEVLDMVKRIISE